MKGFIPIVFQGYVNTLPSDIMIEFNGIVEDVYYAKTDTIDHLPFNKVFCKGNCFVHNNFTHNIHKAISSGDLHLIWFLQRMRI